MTYSLTSTAALLILASAGHALAAGAAIPRATEATRAQQTISAKAAEHALAAAKQDEYEFVVIDIPGASPIGINNRGTVSGFYQDAAGLFHSFVWVRGEIISTDYPGAQHSLVADITDSGRVFGNWGTLTEQKAGYLTLATGKWETLPDIPGYPLNIGQRMSDSGRAVGYACKDSLETQQECTAWLWDGKDYTMFSYPGAARTIPNAINNRGQIVGYWFAPGPPGPPRGFAGEIGQFREISVSNGAGTVPTATYDITNDGKILGAAALDNTGFWPSLLIERDNSFTKLPLIPDVLRTFYQGMNERGDYVGIWFNNPNPTPPDFRGFVALKK